MEAKEVPIKEIINREYFAVAFRYVDNFPNIESPLWTMYQLFNEEEKADLWIAEQKKFNGKPGYGNGKQEFKKFSVMLPI